MRHHPSWMLSGLASCLVLGATGCATKRPVPEEGVVPPGTQEVPLREEGPKRLPQAVAPKEFPRIPPADASAVQAPAGYRVEVLVRDLVYPTSVEVDAQGNVYVAEAGYAYGDLVAPARIHRFTRDGRVELLVDQLNGPVNDILLHEGRLLISHLGKISELQRDGTVRDLVTGLPSSGDHQNNALTVGPDGKLYFGQGVATNAGVVGLDNVYPYLWLTFYPDIHDIPPRDLELEDVTYTTPDPLTVLANMGELVSFTQAAEHLVSPREPLLVRTGAFQPFGRWASRVPGQVKANGTILRMNPDGSGLEVYAWGLRNPFGVQWGPDGTLYAFDLGFDERGSRPIANAPDVLWSIRQGAWYGWPDYAAGIPVTDPRFRSSRGNPPKPLLKHPPPVEKPVLTRPPHTSPMKFDFSRSARFGFAGQMFVAEFGGGPPVTGPGAQPSGYQVVRLDPASGALTPFLQTRREALGPKDYEYAATAGLRRPVDVRFSPDGQVMYVADFGALAGFVGGAGPAVRPFPGSGVIWRVTREGTRVQGPPADLSVLAARRPSPAR